MFNDSAKQPIALGFTVKEWRDMLNTPQASDAQRSLAYFDGQQEGELVKVLNSQRANWRAKPLNPRFRNITKMVVEKSGMIFKDAAPRLAVFDRNRVTENTAATELLYELFSREEFAEFWANFDEILRLLNTALVLLQWDAEEERFIPDILHRGNCEVVLSPIKREIIGLIYRVADNLYQIWTYDEVIELTETRDSIYVSSRQPNPYACIPVSVFYDTNTPRAGFWVEQDKSLVNLNEMVNLHLTDSEYSLLWSKMSTLFTNMRPVGGGSASFETIETQVQNSPIPRTLPANINPAEQAGPGSAVVLDSMGVESPFVRYENPRIDLKPLNEVVNDWIRNQAADWSVRIEVAGQGKAQSGFQFVVEEMPNLELRKQRQRMFEAGFKRMFRTLRKIYNTIKRVEVLPEDADLFATFDAPVLPVDLQQQETVWTVRIKEGRGTEIDYFQTVYGLSRREAEERWLEVVAFMKRKAELMRELQPAQPQQIDDSVDADEDSPEINTSTSSDEQGE